MKENVAIRRLYLPEGRLEDPHAFITSVLASLSAGDLENAAEQSAALSHLLVTESIETQDSRTIPMPTLPDSARDEVLAYLWEALQELIFDQDRDDITYSRDRGVPYAEALTSDLYNGPAPSYDMISSVLFSGGLENHTTSPDEHVEEYIKRAIEYCQDCDPTSAAHILSDALVRLEAIPAES